jgi:hypothetical protein
VKILRTGFDTEPQAIRRFRDEARKCAQVQHQNVVRVYDAGEAEGRPFYAMELVEGERLASRIASGALPEPKALCAAMAGVADGLDRLHQAGVVHRDVKPSNIMVQRDGRMVLVDFGLARDLTSVHVTQTGQLVGTPLYMSPEQMLDRRDEVDARTDVYAVGATLYEALTGSPPFATKDMSALLRMVLFQRPESPRKLRPEIPEAAEHVVMKALEKRREDRYATAGDLRDDLKAVANAREPVGRPVSASRRLARRARPWLVPALGVLVLLAGVGGWWMNRPGTLRLEVEYPATTVTIGGIVRGTAASGRPLEISLAPGDHDVTLSAKWFESKQIPVRIESRSTNPIPLKLAPPPPRHVAKTEAERAEAKKEEEEWSAQFDEFLEYLKSRYPSEPIEDHRGGGGTRGTTEAALALLPRGKVRPEDLASARVEVGMDWPTEAAVEIRFRREGSDEDLIPPIPFKPTMLESEVPLPAALGEALKPGDRVTWGLFPTGPNDPLQPMPAAIRKGAVKASFEVVDARISDVGRPGIDLQGEVVRRVVRGNAYLRSELYTAAARQILAIAPADRPFQAWAVLFDAARLSGLPRDESTLHHEAYAAVQEARGTPWYRARFGGD